jgi:DNA-binding winged helix-turn-helix (wHTH) protein
MRVSFGSFVLDHGARQLERGGHPIHLTPKALSLLALLIERRPNAVSKAEIHDRLWPGTFVADVNLAVLIHDLRDALEDDPREPTYLRTVTRFGYAFCGTVRPAPDAPEWAARSPHEHRLIWGAREIALQPGDNLLGRTHEASIWVDHSSVSRYHALVRVGENGATIEDCGSRNGTFLGANRVADAVPLKDGDRILLGSALLVFRSFSRDRTSTATDGGTHPTGPPGEEFREPPAPLPEPPAPHSEPPAPHSHV